MSNPIPGSSSTGSVVPFDGEESIECSICQSGISNSEVYVPYSYRFEVKSGQKLKIERVAMQGINISMHKNCSEEKTLHVGKKIVNFSKIMPQSSDNSSIEIGLQKEQVPSNLLPIAEYVLDLREGLKEDGSQQALSFLDQLEQDWELRNMDDKEAQNTKNFLNGINCIRKSQGVKYFFRRFFCFLLTFFGVLSLIKSIKISKEKRNFNNDIVLKSLLDEMKNLMRKSELAEGNETFDRRKEVIDLIKDIAILIHMKEEIQKKVDCLIHSYNLFTVASLLHLIGVLFSISTIVLGILQARSILKVKIFKYFLFASLTTLTAGLILFIISQVLFKIAGKEFSEYYPETVEDLFVFTDISDLEDAPAEEF